MSGVIRYDLCPETGIGCILVEQNAGPMKIDLMPDEVQSLKELVKSGDLAGARSLLESMDSRAGELDDAALAAIAQEVN